jgi:hypothetical protein
MQVLAYLELKPLRLAVRHFLEEKKKQTKIKQFSDFPMLFVLGFDLRIPLTRPTILRVLAIYTGMYTCKAKNIVHECCLYLFSSNAR